MRSTSITIDQLHDADNSGTSFAPSSWSSSLGVSEALASYTRSQVIITGQNVASSDVDEDDRTETIDEEAEVATEVMDEDDLSTPMPEQPEHDSFEWDDVLDGPTIVNSQDTERTPLIHKPSRSSVHATQTYTTSSRDRLEPLPQPRLRRKSSASVRSEKDVPSGRSTFGQTLFNSVAILLGFGMLSEPLAFSYAGWVGGFILIVLYGMITCYTAKILAGIMAEDPQIRTYADIGNKAFGPRSRFITSTLFCLELFAVSVVLVTLFGDSLHSVIPTYSSETYKIIGLAILIPSVFCPLALLSYTSILGICSTLLVIVVLLVDGVSKPDAPGSLRSPATTSILPAGPGQLGIAFGLFMAGFSGHAVLPSLAKDMANPKDFNRMINMAFLFATVIYALIGACGYIMFGNSVSDEVSVDLLSTPGYNVFLNKLVVWSLVIMPLTKFALATRPVNITLEIIFGLESPRPSQLHTTSIRTNLASAESKKTRLMKNVLIVIERTVFACLAVAVSIFIPEFSSMMAFVGSFSAFVLCVIGPVAAKMALTRRLDAKDISLMIFAVISAGWGTVAAFAA